MNTEMEKLVSDIKAGKTISVKRSNRVFNSNLKELLTDLETYMEDKADADLVCETYNINEEMQLLNRIREEIKNS